MFCNYLGFICVNHDKQGTEELCIRIRWQFGKWILLTKCRSRILCRTGGQNSQTLQTWHEIVHKKLGHRLQWREEKVSSQCE